VLGERLERRSDIGVVEHAASLITPIRHELLALNELLADDIRVSLRLRAVDISLISEFHGLGGSCRPAIAAEVVLLGEITTESMRDGEAVLSEIDVQFSSDGKIRRMTIAVVDPQALTAAIRNALQEARNS